MRIQVRFKSKRMVIFFGSCKLLFNCSNVEQTTVSKGRLFQWNTALGKITYTLKDTNSLHKSRIVVKKRSRILESRVDMETVWVRFESVSTSVICLWTHIHTHIQIHTLARAHTHRHTSILQQTRFNWILMINVPSCSFW